MFLRGRRERRRGGKGGFGGREGGIRDDHGLVL